MSVPEKSKTDSWMENTSHQIIEFKDKCQLAELVTWLQDLTQKEKQSIPDAVPKTFQARLHNELGLCLLAQERHEEAEAALQNAKELDPNSLNTHYNLGEVSLALGQAEKAHERFSHLITLEPNHPGALYQLGLLHVTKGEKDKALEFFQKSQEYAPLFPGGHFWAGECLLNAEAFDKAIPCFQKAHELSPQHDASLRGLAVCALRLDKFEEALSHCNTLLQQDLAGGQVIALQIQGEAFLGLGQVEEAALSHSRLALLEFDAREFVVHTARQLAQRNQAQGANYATIVLEEIPDLEGALASIAKGCRA